MSRRLTHIGQHPIVTGGPAGVTLRPLASSSLSGRNVLTRNPEIPDILSASVTPAKCQNRLPYGEPAKQNSLTNGKPKIATALDHFLNAVAYAFVLSFPAAQGATL